MSDKIEVSERTHNQLKELVEQYEKDTGWCSYPEKMLANLVEWMHRKKIGGY